MAHTVLSRAWPRSYRRPDMAYRAGPQQHPACPRGHPTPAPCTVERTGCVAPTQHSDESCREPASCDTRTFRKNSRTSFAPSSFGLCVHCRLSTRPVGGITSSTITRLNSVPWSARHVGPYLKRWGYGLPGEWGDVGIPWSARVRFAAAEAAVNSAARYFPSNSRAWHLQAARTILLRLQLCRHHRLPGC